MIRFITLPVTLLVLVLVGCSSERSGSGDAGDGAFLESLARLDWTPGASDLVFMSNRDGNADIYLVPAGDTTWLNLTSDPAQDNWPEWSADGSRIVFQSDRTGNLDIFVMNADGSGLFQLTHDEDHDYLPSWTPDGRVLFTSWRQEAGDSARAQHVYTVQPDGSGMKRMNLAGGEAVSGAVMGPDGRTIVYGREGADRSSDLWLATVDDLVGERITDGAAFYGAPSFSPDGRLLAYYADARRSSDLLVRDLATGAVDTAMVGGRHWYPRWSPDGRWMLSCSEVTHADFDVLVFPVDGSLEPRTLVSGGRRDCEGRWRSGAGSPPPAAP